MRYIFSLLLLTSLAVPIVFEMIAPRWTTHLGGVTKYKAFPPFTLDAFLKGSFQSRFEKWFMRELGVRPFLVKTDNQLNYSLFSQLSSSAKGKAILGEKGHLIEKIYLKRGQGALPPKRAKLSSKVRELSKLQRLLDKKGVKLLILISPNKPSLYPELIPTRYHVPPQTIAPYQSLQVFAEQLREANIPVIVSKVVLESRQDEFPYPFFSPPPGTHWSELGSCLIAEALVKKLRELSVIETGSLRCSVDGMRDFPLPIDRDLLSVANLWTPKRLVQPSPKVVRTYEMSPKDRKSSALFVGTSFLWSLFYNLSKTPLLSHRDMYYYFKRYVPYPRGKERRIDRSKTKWIEKALQHDIVILEANEAFLHRLGYGFPKQMIRHLKDTAS